jgi:polar amino acid transport system substrate-binding protein
MGHHTRWRSKGVVLALLFTASAIAGSPQSSTAQGLQVDQKLHDSLPAKIKSAGVIRIGGAFQSPPHLNADPKEPTKPVGVAVDLTALMAPILGVKFEWVNTAWLGQIPGVQAGSLDALMGQISITAERERGLLDFVPFYKSPGGVAVPAGNPKNAQPDVVTLCGQRIGVTAGSIQVKMLAAVSERFCPSTGKGPINVVEFQTAAAAITALLSGQTDGYYDQSETVRGIARTSNGRLSPVTLNYEQTKEWWPGLLGIAVTKENTGLTNALLGAMQKIVADGSYAKVLEKYELTVELKPSDVVANPLTKTPIGSKQPAK